MSIGITFKINSGGLLEIVKSEKTVRESKGKSLLEFPEKFCVIDIETTGLDPRFDEIIEIAAVKVENGVIIEEKSSLVKPSEEIYEYITELTGITNEMVEHEQPIDVVLKDFISFWDGYTLVGHNVNFDINFLYDNSMESYNEPITNNFVDTMRLSKRLLPELSKHKLASLIEHFSLDTTVEHRALSDAKNTMAILYRLNEVALEKFETTDNLAKFFSTFKKGVRAADITATETEFDESHPFFDKTFVFTGTLEKMVRRDAMQVVVNFGGHCADSVNKKTNFLVLGNQDYSKIKDNKSSKHKKAEQLKLSGQDIEIISENVFYDMLEPELFITN